MRYTLKQIEVFVATAHCQNITLASEQLSMSQSAASEALKNLEAQFNIQLFDRVGKTLKLNSLGVEVKIEAERLLDQANTLQTALKQDSNNASLNVGATLSIGNYLAINIISAFRTLYPGANVSLDVENTTRIADKVANFELDIGLIEGEVSHKDLEVNAWRDDELVVFCAPNHPCAKLKTLSDEDLTASQWVLRESGSGTRQAFDYAMHGLLAELDITLELQHTEAIKRAVEANMGLGCLSKITLIDAFKRGTLIPLNIPQRNFKRKFYFISHKKKYKSAEMRHWIDMCQRFT